MLQDRLDADSCLHPIFQRWHEYQMLSARTQALFLRRTERRWQSRRMKMDFQARTCSLQQRVSVRRRGWQPAAAAVCSGL